MIDAVVALRPRDLSSTCVGFSTREAKEIGFAAKAAVRRRVRIMITMAHKRMAAGELGDAVTKFELAEKACIDLLGFDEEMVGEIHHSLAYCHERLGDRTRCKVRCWSR